MEYSIGEFSRLTGLGIHTLRYYEKEKLLSPARDGANRRRYSKEDLAWAEFIQRLKSTDMPIKEIRRYAMLRAGGDATIGERLRMLIAHRERLDKRLGELQGHMEKLDDKIRIYRGEYHPL